MSKPEELGVYGPPGRLVHGTYYKNTTRILKSGLRPSDTDIVTRHVGGVYLIDRKFAKRDRYKEEHITATLEKYIYDMHLKSFDGLLEIKRILSPDAVRILKLKEFMIDIMSVQVKIDIDDGESIDLIGDTECDAEKAYPYVIPSNDITGVNRYRLTEFAIKLLADDYAKSSSSHYTFAFEDTDAMDVARSLADRRKPILDLVKVIK